MKLDTKLVVKTDGSTTLIPKSIIRKGPETVLPYSQHLPEIHPNTILSFHSRPTGHSSTTKFRVGLKQSKLEKTRYM
jgi:hypothetical protein